jgi:hypothetical protein
VTETTFASGIVVESCACPSHAFRIESSRTIFRFLLCRLITMSIRFHLSRFPAIVLIIHSICPCRSYRHPSPEPLSSPSP